MKATPVPFVSSRRNSSKAILIPFVTNIGSPMRAILSVKIWEKREVYHIDNTETI
jgi:hypothetical protein